MTHKHGFAAHFDKEGGHSLRSVVVARDSIHHLYGGDEAGNGLQHAHRVTLIEWLAELLQGVQVLEVVFCLIRGICDVSIKLTPYLNENKMFDNMGSWLDATIHISKFLQ